jgi:hypothetical protein
VNRGYCRVCAEPGARVAVDAALLAGQSEARIARQFGFSSSGIHRHKQKCVQRSLELIRRDEEAVHSSELKADIVNLAAEAKRLQGDAEKAGSLGLALQALRELRGLLELRAKLYMGAAVKVGAVKNLQINVVYGEKRDGTGVPQLPSSPASPE